MASAIKSKKKLILIHFPLLDIRVPLYYYGKQHFVFFEKPCLFLLGIFGV